MQNEDLILLDANALLRYFLSDDEDSFRIVKDVIDANRCLILPGILQEVLYVLNGPTYNTPREEAVAAIRSSYDCIEYFEYELIDKALSYYNPLQARKPTVYNRVDDSLSI